MKKFNPGRQLALWTFIAIFLVSFSGCSPLQIVSGLSADDSAATVTQISYGKEKRQRLDMYIPQQIKEGSPVVVFFYGGSWKRGEKEKYGFVGHTLSGKGYITVVPDYRLYPEVTFPAFVEDGALAISWLRENIEQAQNGVVVMGHSAGAHTAALLALDKKYLEGVGQPQNIIRGMIGLAGPYGFDPMKYRSTRPIFAGSKPTAKTKPVTYACSATSPLLLFHGEDDGVVIAENSRELSRSINECGGSVEYIEIAEMGHFSIVLGLSNSFLGEEEVLLPIETFLQTITDQQEVIHSPS